MTSPLPGYAAHFGVENVPFGIASSKLHPAPQCVTRFGDNVIFLADIVSTLEAIQALPQHVFSKPTLNDFATLPRSVHQQVRKRLQSLFETLPNIAQDQDEHSKSSLGSAVETISAVTMHLPVQCSDFTDFSCSADHVQNASEAMTGTRSHPPAFFHQPVGYAGRCSSLDISGTPQARPYGQFWSGKPGASEIVFGPSRRMDFELELGCIIGKPLARKERLDAKDAGEHIFGFVLINDWSARDIQGFEMSPLGPLNGKNLGTSVSPWVITPDALASFRTSSVARQENVPVRPYLSDHQPTALNIQLQVQLSSPSQTKPTTICRSSTADLYWTLEQCIAQQALAGCGLQTGDLIATGTVSGSSESEHGCLMEFMKAGTTPPCGYLGDGETVLLDGVCAEGVGFGECVGILMGAKETKD